MSLPILKRILLVEDDPDIQAVARVALEVVGGFEVQICGSGSEALEKGPAFKPDLAILDIMMPGLDGPATLAAFKRIPPLSQVPAIFMSAKSLPHEVEQYQQLGSWGLIAKPFDPMTLAERVRGIWESHLALQ